MGQPHAKTSLLREKGRKTPFCHVPNPTSLWSGYALPLTLQTEKKMEGDSPTPATDPAGGGVQWSRSIPAPGDASLLHLLCRPGCFESLADLRNLQRSFSKCPFSLGKGRGLVHFKPWLQGTMGRAGRRQGGAGRHSPPEEPQKCLNTQNPQPLPSCIRGRKEGLLPQAGL